MPKPALGRGLGNLLNGTKPVSPSPEPTAQPAKLSPGMATLLRAGEEPAEKIEEQVRPQPVKPQSELLSVKRLLQVSLVLADVLLVCLATLIALSVPGQLGAIGVTLCIVAFVVGAWLSCLALRL